MPAGSDAGRDAAEPGGGDVVDGPVVDARPVLTARIAVAAAAFVLLVMVIVALLEPSQNAGATFDWKDQVFTVVIGVILAAALLLPVRPRLHADADGVHLRGFTGGFKTIPWELVQRVEFPASARFARLVLPAEEAVAVTAVQRADRELAIAAMRGLRQLFALTHPTD
jgi:Bacterial PH domain